MRILVCNDDGVKAPGLRLLADAARTLSTDVWIIAPERKWTAASHQLTFDRTLTLSRIEDRVFACSGAPADCVIAAMTIVMPEERPGLVLAGINDKANVGEDLAYSGTTAIAREAAFWGIPAISLSRTERSIAKSGDRSAVAQLLEVLWSCRATWAQEGCWLGVNLPASLPAPIVSARLSRDKIGGAVDVLERRTERTTFRLRRGRPGSHVAGDENAGLAAGAITVACFSWHAQVPLAADALNAPGGSAKMPD
ncbi:MAG TPA: 5'/3'-nucleotidase SurE [Casimicrobiaceae bacterium]|nr:5'/3'-nucleotidase SurE [Casimicrobiaceae bacterium]